MTRSNSDGCDVDIKNKKYAPRGERRIVDAGMNSVLGGGHSSYHLESTEALRDIQKRRRTPVQNDGGELYNTASGVGMTQGLSNPRAMPSVG